MSVGGAVRAGLALVGGLLGCGRAVARLIGSHLLEPLTGRSVPDEDVPSASVPARDPVDETGGTQARVEEAKYSLGLPDPRPVAVRVDRELRDLPRAYGNDRVVLLPRDPWWLFAYWEITPTSRVQALRMLGAEAEGAREVLRVYDVTFITFTGDNAWHFFDVELPPGTENWYINVSRPAASYCVEVGLRTPAGRFVALERSNTVTTPRAAPSPDTSVHWARLDDRGVSDASVPWVGQRVPTAAQNGPTGAGSSEASGASRERSSASSEVHTPPPR